MLGTKFYKTDFIPKNESKEEKERVDAVQAQYAELAVWCDCNHATIVDKGDYFEAVGLPDNTEEIRKALALRTAKEMISELQRIATVRSIPLEDDATALTIAPVCPDWKAGTHYEARDVVNHNGQAYKVIQAVDSLENQPPDAEGMLAIYRPLMPEHEGTLEDPIPFVSGMDVYNGKYYSYNGSVYLAKTDMLPCTWAPDTEGMWQWELVSV